MPTSTSTSTSAHPAVGRRADRLLGVDGHRHPGPVPVGRARRAVGRRPPRWPGAGPRPGRPPPAARPPAPWRTSGPGAPAPAAAGERRALVGLDVRAQPWPRQRRRHRRQVGLQHVGVDDSAGVHSSETDVTGAHSTAHARFTGRKQARNNRLSASPHVRQWEHRLDVDLDRPGALHDTRAGVLLRRHGPQQERPRDADAELRRHGPDRRAVGAGGLHASPSATPATPASSATSTSSASTGWTAHGGAGVLRPHDPVHPLRRLPDDLRHHHAGADHRAPPPTA